MTQKTLTSFTGSTDSEKQQEGSENRESDVEESQVALFELTSDDFVNMGAADLCAQLDTEITITPASIRCNRSEVDATIEQLREIVEAGLANTHRRKSIAHSVNFALEEAGYGRSDARWAPATTEPFPDDVTIYQDDSVNLETLSDQGIPITDQLDEISGDTTLYTLSAEYLGITQGQYYAKQQERFERYLEVMRASLSGEVSDDIDDHYCSSCGRQTLPTYSDPLSDSNDKIDYNQTFAPLVSTSGQVRPLGGGSRQSTHKGRCVACLIAGFHFMHMHKVVRQTETNENDSRIFVPVGDFEKLTRVAGDLQQILSDLDSRVGDQNARTRTLGKLQTRSLPMQALDLYEQIYRKVNAEYSGGAFQAEVEYRPTELVTLVSEVGRTRDIKNLKRIKPADNAYRIISPDNFSPSAEEPDEEYWPVSDVLRWFAEAGEPGTLIPIKNNISNGIITGNLQSLEHGVSEFARGVLQSEIEMPGYATPHPRQLHTCFTTLIARTMTENDAITEEDIEAIRNVASSVGSVFHQGEDIGVLIGLQNAGTQQEFLRAFEKASMQAQKRSVDSPPAKFNTTHDDDVETVLRLINSDETFDRAKRMFVIHTALSAQYENATSRQNSKGGEAA